MTERNEQPEAAARWKRTDLARRRLTLVVEITRLEAKLVEAGMFKTVILVRENLLPMAIDDAADSPEGLPT